MVTKETARPTANPDETSWKRRPRPKMVYEVDEFNVYQNFLYKRALFGLSMYTPEEVRVMHWDKKNRIERVNRHAKNVLNLWKQEMSIVLTNHLFETKFPRSPFLGELLGIFKNATDIHFLNTLTFKQLKISKRQIVEKLMLEGVLPKDFFSLKPPIKQESKKDVETGKSTNNEIRVLS